MFDLPRNGYAFVALFDCLYFVGDLASAVAHMYASIKPDGVWFIVEPLTNDHWEKPEFCRSYYYSALTFMCMPVSRSQEVEACLDTRGKLRRREIVTTGGFDKLLQRGNRQSRLSGARPIHGDTVALQA